MLQMTTGMPQTLEDMIPADAPQPILPKNCDKTLRVKLKRNYWTFCKTTTGKPALYAGQVVVLPYAEGRSVVEKNIATLMFDDDPPMEEKAHAIKKG
jgi:hypothetical protein